MNTRNTMYRRRPAESCARTVSPVEMALLTLFVVALFATAWLTGRMSTEQLDTLSLRVRPGQTLWAIAREYPTPGRSTAETVQLLTDLNGLEGGALVAGAVLRVPAADGDTGLNVASR